MEKWEITSLLTLSIVGLLIGGFFMSLRLTGHAIAMANLELTSTLGLILFALAIVLGSFYLLLRKK